MALGLVLACPVALVGMNQAFAIVALPQLDLGVADASWFVSISAFSAPIGSILIGFMVDKYGRRVALLYGVLPSCFGHLAMYYGSTLGWLFIGRTLNGLCLGAVMYPPQVYASEFLLVNHRRLRDSFKIWTGLAGSVGSLATFVISLRLDYRQLSGFVCVVSFLEFALIYVFLPESASWLQFKGRHGDAEWSQKKLGVYLPSSSDRELIFHPPGDFQWSEFMGDLWKVKRPDVYKPLVSTVLLFTCLLGSGGLAVIMYMVEIIGNSPGAESQTRIQESTALQYSIVSALLVILANIMVCFTLPSLGIRKLTIPCLIGMGASLAVLAFTTVRNSAELYFLRAMSVWVIVFTFNLGVFNLPGALLGNVFPVDAKGFASVSVIVFCLLGATTTKIHLYLELAFGGYLYYGYSIIAFCSALFAYFIMPETVGRSQEQISGDFVRLRAREMVI